MRHDGAESRRERIAEIARTVQAALFQNKEAGWIPLSTTVSRIMVDTGLTKNKVSEYLQLLSATGQIEISVEDDKIRKPVVQIC